MKILVADDSFDWLNTHTMVCMGVFGEDTQIVSACSAGEAFNIYQEEYKESPFDLVITDLQMESDFEPQLAGEWLIKEIKVISPKQKIMVVSSSFNIDKVANAYNVDHFSKRLIVSDIDGFVQKLKTLYL